MQQQKQQQQKQKTKNKNKNNSSIFNKLSDQKKDGTFQFESQ